jgi:CheY-like chemotaxis protein
MDRLALSINILLVDPNKDDRALCAERLSADSPAVTIFEAETGAAALAICQSEAIDCILLELHLPDMSGLQVLNRLIPRAYHPQIPVNLFSHMDLPSMNRLARNNGAQAYLLKPACMQDELMKVIRKAIGAVPVHKQRHS